MLAPYSSGLEGNFFVAYLQVIFKFEIVSKRKKKPPKQNNDAHRCVLRDTKQFTKDRWDDVILCSSICWLLHVKSPSHPSVPTCRLFLGSVPSIIFNTTMWVRFSSQLHRMKARASQLFFLTPESSPLSLLHPAPNHLNCSPYCWLRVFLKPKPACVTILLKICQVLSSSQSIHKVPAP